MGYATLIVVFLVFVVGALVFLLKMKKSADEAVESAKEDGLITDDNALNPNTTITELPFKEIKDSMIYLGDDQYRMVIECSSINLSLKTPEEQEVVEMSFQGFLQTLKYPFAFYVQTREIDNSKIIENTYKDAAEIVRKFPFMLNYAENYMKSLNQMNEASGNTKSKKKYLIITYNDLRTMQDIDEDDKWDLAFDELETRARSAIYGLHEIGINAHVLNSAEIAEMVFRAYNKEDSSLIEGMTSGEMVSIMVDSEKHVSYLSKDEEIDILINKFFRSLETNVINDRRSTDAQIEAAHQTIDIINKVRDRMGSPYKRYSSSDRNGTLEEMMRDLNRKPVNREPSTLRKSELVHNKPSSNDDELFDL